jgi:transposase
MSGSFNEPALTGPPERMKGYVAVQKRLLLIAFALWRHDLEYDPLYLTNRTSGNKKIVPTSGTTQDQLAQAELSYV